MVRRISLLIVLLPCLSSAQFAASLSEPECVKVSCPESNSFLINNCSAGYTAPVLLENSLHRGWPVDLSSPGAGFPYTPTLFDINGNGADEIFLVGGNAFGLSGDGTFLPGWPTTEHLYMGYGTNDQMPGPSVADLEGNGSVEILWSERDWYAGSAHMWTLNGRNSNGSNISGLPQNAPDESSNALNSPFVLGDSDGDGNLEAWTAHTLGNTGD
ncbi:MAG: VCBS repeat-containing protein, partial [bacterium]|nr:VCBS repeat-containing protein [bacterium]